MMFLYRIVVLVILLFSSPRALCANGSNRAEPARAKIVQLFPDQEARGEIVVMTLQGNIDLRVRGFKRISTINYLTVGRVLVVDEGRGQVLLLDWALNDPRVVSTWRLPAGVAGITQVELLSSDDLLLVTSDGGVVVVSRTGERQLPVTIKGMPLKIAALAISSGSEALAVGYASQRGDSRLYALEIARGEAEEVALPAELTANGRLAFRSIHQVGGRFFFSDSDSMKICQGNFESRQLVNVSCEPLRYPPALVSFDSRSNILALDNQGFLTYMDRAVGSTTHINYEISPTSMSFDGQNGLILLGHERRKGHSWPAYGALPTDRSKQIDWHEVWSVFVKSAVGLLLVAVFIGWIAPFRSLQHQDATEEELVASSKMRATAFYFSLFCMTALYGAAWWCQWRVVSDLNGEYAAWSYLLVALLFAAFGRLTLRGLAGSRSSIFVCPSPGTMSTLHRILTGVFCLILLALASYILCLPLNYGQLTKKTTAWFVGGACIVASLVADLVACRKLIVRAITQEAAQLGVLALVACATLFYRLETIPYSTHFDFTIPALWAWRVLTGVVIDIWTIGYTPVPVAGLFPEMTGLYLFGPTPLGFRVGSALFGLSGIVAVYLLGRAYKGPWLGFWAALFLAGNSTYMHFSRLTTCGSAITVAVWVVSLFLLAWKYRLASLWLLLGVMGGLAMYQWPVSRVGGASVAVCLALLVIRHPMQTRARALGLLLALLGFVVVTAPVIRSWLFDPGLLFPRANTILPVPSKYTGLLGWLDSAFGEEFFRCFAWFFYERDYSSQGSISPSLNSFEAVAFALGLACMIFEGWSINLVMAPLLLITLTICGSLTRQPWYTRLFPTVLVAVVCMALTFYLFHQFLRSKSRRLAQIFGVACSIAIIWSSPVANLQTYIRHEDNFPRANHREPLVAVGRKMFELGPKFQFGIVGIGNAPWHLEHAFSRLLPYIMQLRVSDVVDLEAELPVSSEQSYVFVIQPARAAKDVPLIKSYHPNAQVEAVVDPGGYEVAQVVIVGAQS